MSPINSEGKSYEVMFDVGYESVRIELMPFEFFKFKTKEHMLAV
jgi:hypothetical protein